MLFRAEAAIERAQAGIDRLMALIPPAARERVEVRPRSATEVGLLLHGLEFARVRQGFAANSFAQRGRDHALAREPTKLRLRRRMSRSAAICLRGFS